MNKIFSFLFSSLSFIILFSSCGDNRTNIEYNYRILVQNPNSDSKSIGDTLKTYVTFESLSGETVHHVNMSIYSKLDGKVIYSKPNTAHVHRSDGKYEYEDEIVLSLLNGFTPDSEWIFEARVWGENDGEGEVIEKIAFRVKA